MKTQVIYPFFVFLLEITSVGKPVFFAKKKRANNSMCLASQHTPKYGKTEAERKKASWEDSLHALSLHVALFVWLLCHLPLFCGLLLKKDKKRFWNTTFRSRIHFSFPFCVQDQKPQSKEKWNQHETTKRKTSKKRGKRCTKCHSKLSSWSQNLSCLFFACICVIGKRLFFFFCNKTQTKALQEKRSEKGFACGVDFYLRTPNVCFVTTQTPGDCE